MPLVIDLPAANLVPRDQNGRIFYEAKFRHGGEQIWRRIGPAWLEIDPEAPVGARGHERFRSRRGRVQPGFFDERAAHVKAAEIVRAYVTDAADAEQKAEERRSRGATFRDVAQAYMDWLEHVRAAAPSTMRQHQSDLAEPGVPYRRGQGVTAGHIMRAFGDTPAARVTTRDVDELLEIIAGMGVTARTVNRYRDVVRAVFNFGMKSSKFKLANNPATDADSRRVSALGDLVYYTPDEIRG